MTNAVLPDRDRLEIDVLFVGAGPATLAGAIRLGQLAKAGGRELEVYVIEKAGEIGNHGISGAVMDPRALDELLPDWREQARRSNRPSRSDEMWYLTQERKNQSADRAAAAAQSRQVRRIACRRSPSGSARKPKKPARKSFPVSRPGIALGRRRPRRRRSHRRQRHSTTRKPKSNYEPGADILAKVVVLGEGPRGTLAKQAIPRLGLDDGRQPQVYAAGVKELWHLARRSVRGRRRGSYAGISVASRNVRRRLHLRNGGQRARHRARHRSRLSRSDDRSAQRTAADENRIPRSRRCSPAAR